MRIASIEARPHGTRILLRGSVDLDGARALLELLKGSLPGPVTVDVSGAEGVQDVALGVLGLWLALQPEGAVSIRGLDSHGALVLRACGVRAR